MIIFHPQPTISPPFSLNLLYNKHIRVFYTKLTTHASSLANTRTLEITKMHPLPEYPRPSMRRDSYVNLNGPWDYAITQSSEFPAKWDGAILVPYSPEAKASGVGRTLQPGQWLHCHRTFTPPAGEGGRVLLHFGAVDYACAVEVNGKSD